MDKNTPATEPSAKTGHEVIEAALKRAINADAADAPFPLDPDQAAIWHQAQASAYQHALEMIPTPAAAGGGDAVDWQLRYLPPNGPWSRWMPTSQEAFDGKWPYDNALQTEYRALVPATPGAPVMGGDLGRLVRIGDLPAPITNPEAWPPGYADGFNDYAKHVEQTQSANTPAGGFVVVPREPTEEMELAAENYYEANGMTFPDWKAAYREMVGVAVAMDPVRVQQGCSCPSGDGSLRWPCEVHPTPTAQPSAKDGVRGEDSDPREIIGECRRKLETALSRHAATTASGLVDGAMVARAVEAYHGCGIQGETLEEARTFAMTRALEAAIGREVGDNG